MRLEVVRDVLMWCSIVNVVLFLVAFLALKAGNCYAVRKHSEWYGVPEDTVRAVLYGMMVFYKTCITVLNVVPFVALSIIL